jgi:Uma2 family endonuclease
VAHSPEYLVASLHDVFRHGIKCCYELVIARQLEPPCRVLNEAGVARPDQTESYFQPDLLVTYAPPERGRQVPPEPVLIAEVLSPSTALHDRGRKVDAYCLLPSVREVLLVWSDERRVQHWTRAGARWTVENLIGSADLRLDLVPEPLSLDAIYDGSGT